MGLRKTGLGLGSCVYNRIKVLRLLKGMSQDELAKAIRKATRKPITRVNITRIENFTSRPSVKTAESICKALGATFNDVFYIDNNHIS